VFDRVCRESQCSGAVVSDAYLAALAIEHGCTLITCDNDFARFP
jgi:predicted nucleic acid-binding protein